MEITLNLPDEWKDFVEAETAARGCAGPADYIQTLLAQARLHQARGKVEALLEAGINSGPATEWTEEDWQEIEERHAQPGRTVP